MTEVLSVGYLGTVRDHIAGSWKRRKGRWCDQDLTCGISGKSKVSYSWELEEEQMKLAWPESSLWDIWALQGFIQLGPGRKEQEEGITQAYPRPDL